MRAEREKRAAILTAEGVKQSQILDGRGREAGRDPAAPRASAQAAILAAEGEAQAIETVFQRHPRRRRRPEAARLPVPAGAAADRAGRRRTRSGSSRASSRRRSASSASSRSRATTAAPDPGRAAFVRLGCQQHEAEATAPADCTAALAVEPPRQGGRQWSETTSSNGGISDTEAGWAFVGWRAPFASHYRTVWTARRGAGRAAGTGRASGLDGHHLRDRRILLREPAGGDQRRQCGRHDRARRGRGHRGRHRGEQEPHDPGSRREPERRPGRRRPRTAAGRVFFVSGGTTSADRGP